MYTRSRCRHNDVPLPTFGSIFIVPLAQFPWSHGEKLPWRRRWNEVVDSFSARRGQCLGKKKEKLNRTSKFFPPSLCRASSDIIPSSQIRSILFTLPLSLPLFLSLDPLENFFHEISSKKWIRWPLSTPCCSHSRHTYVIARTFCRRSFTGYPTEQGNGAFVS